MGGPGYTFPVCFFLCGWTLVCPRSFFFRLAFRMNNRPNHEIDHPAAKAGKARLSWREKISYGIADMGFNFYWTNIATFLLISIPTCSAFRRPRPRR